MNIALWDQLDFYTKRVDIERNKAVRSRFQFVGNSCEKDSWAILLCQHDNTSNDTAVLSNPMTEIEYNNDDELQSEERDGVQGSSEEEDNSEAEDDGDSDYVASASARKKTNQQTVQRFPKRVGGPTNGTNVATNSRGQVICPTCGKMFKTMGELRQHEPFHTRVRSFICTVCQKSFLYASSYYAHKRRHVQPRSSRSISSSVSPDTVAGTRLKINSTSSHSSNTRRPRGSENSP